VVIGKPGAENMWSPSGKKCHGFTWLGLFACTNDRQARRLQTSAPPPPVPQWVKKEKCRGIRNFPIPPWSKVYSLAHSEKNKKFIRTRITPTYATFWLKTHHGKNPCKTVKNTSRLEYFDHSDECPISHLSQYNDPLTFFLENVILLTGTAPAEVRKWALKAPNLKYLGNLKRRFCIWSRCSGNSDRDLGGFFGKVKVGDE